MRTFSIVLCLCFSSMAAADITIKQSVKNDKGSHSATHYIAKGVMRIDNESEKGSQIMLIRGSKIVRCNRDPGGEKFSCTPVDLADINKVFDKAGVSVELKNYKVKKLKKKGKFAGRSCQFYSRTTEYLTKMQGISSTVKTKERFCADANIRMPKGASSAQMVANMGAIVKGNDLKLISKAEKKVKGLPLYSKMETTTAVDMGALKGMLGKMAPSPKEQKSTSITQTQSVQEGKLSPSLFKLRGKQYVYPKKS